MSDYKVIACINFLLLCLGLVLRKKKNFHVPLMLSAILSDLSLVVLLEVQRQAIDTALSFSSNLLQKTHIISSTLAVVFYIPTVIYGVLRLKTKPPCQKINKRHKNLGLIAFTFRTIGFIFMFGW